MECITTIRPGHMTEQRGHGGFGTRAVDGSAPVVFVLTSIVWRESWTYGERAYRYCLHDIGHAWQALALSARAIGCDSFAAGHFPQHAYPHLYDPVLISYFVAGNISVGFGPSTKSVAEQLRSHDHELRLRMGLMRLQAKAPKTGEWTWLLCRVACPSSTKRFSVKMNSSNSWAGENLRTCTRIATAQYPELESAGNSWRSSSEVTKRLAANTLLQSG